MIEASQLAEAAGRAAAQLPEEASASLLDAIESARRVFVAGAGRSGLVARAFVIRLAQMGVPCAVAGEPTAPRAGEGDLLVCISRSGTTPTVLALADIGRSAGCRVAWLGAAGKVPSDPAPDLILELPTTGGVPGAWLGTLFETAAWLWLDALVGRMAQRRGLTEEDLRAGHANLE